MNLFFLAVAYTEDFAFSRTIAQKELIFMVAIYTFSQINFLIILLSFEPICTYLN